MFREITTNDKEIFFTLLDEFYHSSAVISPIPKSYYEEIFSVMLDKNNGAKAYMVEEDGTVVGYGVVSLTFSMEAGGKTLWLEDLYLRKDYRSKGIGTKYLEFIFGEYKDVKRFRLEVEKDNVKSVALCKKMGFKFLEYDQMILDK